MLQSRTQEKASLPPNAPFYRIGFQLMMYTVLSHHVHHLPEVWDDTFDVTYQAMPVCRVQTSRAWPVTSNLHAGVDHNQVLWP